VAHAKPSNVVPFPFPFPFPNIRSLTLAAVFRNSVVLWGSGARSPNCARDWYNDGVTPSAILVLGARVRAGGAPGPALRRRIDAALEASRLWPGALVIACGGRGWDGLIEADVIARGLVARGLDPERIVRDRLSLTTIENLREGVALARTRNACDQIAVVTCDWHAPRALVIARAIGIDAIAHVARAPRGGLARTLRERFLRAIVPFVVISVVLACKRPKNDGVDAASAVASSSAWPTVTSADVVAAHVAADRRHSGGVPIALASAGDPAARRVAARALAQIGDAVAVERLGRSLSDDDPEVVAWSAYGLGLPCDLDPDLAREDRAKIVRAIVARAASLEVRGTSALDPWSAMAWSLGRCGGLDASRELARWLRVPERARSAAWALGAIAGRDRGLEDDVAAALLDAAKAGVDDALFPFGRGDWSSRPPTAGLAAAARMRLAGSSRVFAIRALGRADGAKPEELRALVTDAATPEAERVEALRALHRMGPKGDAEIAAFATRNAPTDEARTNALTGRGFGSVRVAIELLGERDPTKTTTSSLRAFVSKAPIAAAASATIARRLATLRCLAASALHPGKPGEAEVVRCAAHDPTMAAPLRAELDTIRDLARLQTLDRAEITGEKRDLLVKLARDGAPRVRERALAMLGKHAETEEAPDVIIRALSSKSLGIVAEAARALAARPSLGNVMSKKSIKETLDPTSPPPDKVVDAEKTLDPKVLEAVDGALARPMEEADAEIKTALAAAVGALKHTKARGFALRLCSDRTPALRRAGRDALALLDPPGKAPACATIDDHGIASPYASVPQTKKTLKLETDAGVLTLSLDPAIAPIAVARIAELAASGFYDGTPIHRVVPGFVVQLGDPGGDGYGGAHLSLRCETAPVPFGEGDIGVALAGRDTGSSQIFVMLGRAPHLDGSYAHLGKATGSWANVAEGDRVIKATVQ